MHIQLVFLLRLKLMVRQGELEAQPALVVQVVVPELVVLQDLLLQFNMLEE